MVYTSFNNPATLLKLDQTNLPCSKGSDGGEIVAVFGKQNASLPLPSASSIFTVEVNAIYFALIFATSSDKFYFIICLHSITCLLATGTGKSQKPFIFQIIEMYLNLVDMRRKIIYLWIPGDGNIVVD